MDAPFASPQLRFVAPLGRGGTADVAKAQADHLNRLVAVKYPLAEPDDDVDFSTLARREWDLIGQARFPGLIHILEQPSEQPPYLLLALCTGPTLDTVGKIESLPLALSVLSAVAVSLEYLNAAGLVHGDFKPHNVFLPETWASLSPDSLYWARLSDFSLGRRIDEPEAARLGAGTVGYMAPETISDGVTSHRSDLFAFGVLAYQVLSGQHPFMQHSTDPVQINGAVREADYLPLPKIRPDLPPGLVALVDSLLALDPGARPDSAWAVGEELRQLGSRYPFEKALRPAHLWRRDWSYEANRVAILTDHNRTTDRLDRITSQSPEQLRLCLTANFMRHNLHYTGGGFAFDREPIWPCRLRLTTARHWLTQPLTERKKAIRKTVQWLGTPPEERRGAFNSAMTQLLPGLLRVPTIKRLARTEGKSARAEYRYEHASRYFLLAGDLEAAEQCADQAGRALQREHQHKRALRVLNNVLESAALRDRAFDTRHLLLTKAEVQKDNGDVEAAMVSYNRLVTLYESREPDKILAEAYKDIGDLYKMKKEVARGLEALQMAHEIFERLDDTLELSHTQNNMGNLQVTAGNLDAARQHYRKALRIQRRLDALGDVASTLNNLAATYIWRGNFARGIHLFQLALGIQQERGNKVEIARALNNLGYATGLHGRFTEAIDSLQRSLDLNREIGNRQEIQMNLDNLIHFMISAGRLRESLQHLKEGIALTEAQSEVPQQAEMRLLTAVVYRHLGRVSESLEAVDDAAQLIRAVDDEPLQLRIELQRAAIRLAIGDRAGALDSALHHREVARRLQDPTLELAALLLAARVRVDDKLVEAASTLAARFHYVREQRLLAANQLEASLDAGLTDRITPLYSELIRFDWERLEDIENARVGCLLAEAALLERDRMQARQYLAFAERSARASGQALEMVRVAALAARIEFDAGAYETCFARVKEGMQVAKKISDSLTDEADRKTFQQLRMIQYLGARARELKARLGSGSQK